LKSDRNRKFSGSGGAVFVMPYFADAEFSREYFLKALRGLEQQSCPGWKLVVVNDGSPRKDEVSFLEKATRTEGRITLLHQPVNRGPGLCRNIGVRWALENDADIILFHDSDDVSHPERLEVTRRIFSERPEVDMVYSSFQVIDEYDRIVPEIALTSSIAEILDAHRNGPLEGDNAWIRIGTDTGYTTQTSTVGVRAHIAQSQSFPDVRGSEDTHTWYRMCADGNTLAFMPGIITQYRVPNGLPSSDRARIGSDRYYRTLVDMNIDGFNKARDIALSRQAISPERAAEIYPVFLRRLSMTLLGERQFVLAERVSAEAEKYEARCP
jgi:glycosyltransferase involved in cell wall biosynthesis